nr:hypothetical protein [Streptomyces sp. RB17]
MTVTGLVAGDVEFAGDAGWDGVAVLVEDEQPSVVDRLAQQRPGRLPPRVEVGGGDGERPAVQDVQGAQFGAGALGERAAGLTGERGARRRHQSRYGALPAVGGDRAGQQLERGDEDGDTVLGEGARQDGRVVARGEDGGGSGGEGGRQRSVRRVDRARVQDPVALLDAVLVDQPADLVRERVVVEQQGGRAVRARHGPGGGERVRGAVDGRDGVQRRGRRGRGGGRGGGRTPRR